MKNRKNACCIKNEKGQFVAWCTGYSDQDIEALLQLHPGWYRCTEA